MKKTLLVTTFIVSMALASACSSNKAAEKSNTEMKVESSMAKEENTSDIREIEGIVSEKKNVLFSLTDDQSKTYGFSFDENEIPQGFDEIKNDDKVKVKFRFEGELSEVDPITDIISIEKLDK